MSHYGHGQARDFYQHYHYVIQYIVIIKLKVMTRSNTILLAALGGAAVAALVANYLSTEQGRQLLTSASESLKEVSGKAKEIAKNNLSEVLDETKNTVGQVVKEKLAQQLSR
jgi:hypothetical protein